MARWWHTAVVLTFGVMGCQPMVSAAGATVSDAVVPPGFRLAAPLGNPGGPLRFWVLGDSVMNDASPALAAALSATGEAAVVADSSIGGFGLSRVPMWAMDSRQIIEDYHPQVVIGTWSWDDTLAQNEPVAYGALLRQALSVWLTPGDGVELVVLVEFPQIGPNPVIGSPLLRQRLWATLTLEQRAWDREAEQVVSDFPGRAVYLSTDQVFAPGGSFRTWFQSPDGRYVRVRQIDNIHLCPFGAAALANALTEDLVGILGLPSPAPGWEFGSWTQLPRYQVGPLGPGACPDDQPLPGYDGIPVPTLGRGG
jgi:hypothetical protein